MIILPLWADMLFLCMMIAVFINMCFNIISQKSKKNYQEIYSRLLLLELNTKEGLETIEKTAQENKEKIEEIKKSLEFLDKYKNIIK